MVALTANSVVLEHLTQELLAELRLASERLERASLCFPAEAGTALKEAGEYAAKSVRRGLESDIEGAGLKARAILDAVQRSQSRTAIWTWITIGLLAGVGLFGAGAAAGVPLHVRAAGARVAWIPSGSRPCDVALRCFLAFLEHLEELRWHVVRGVGAIIIFTIVGFIYVDWVFNEILLAPAKANFWTWRMLCKLGHAMDKVDLLCIQDIPLVLQSRYMTGQFTITIVSAFVLGLVLAFPYVIWEAWRFIKP